VTHQGAARDVASVDLRPSKRRKDIVVLVDSLAYSVMQCWCRSNWRLHRSEHRSREDALRGRCRHVPDCQDVAISATVDGSERGTADDCSVRSCQLSSLNGDFR